MPRRQRRRFLTLGLVIASIAAALAAAAVSWADIIAPDADLVTVGNQTSRNLGTVAPGATLTPAVTFELQCNGNQHVDLNGSVSLTYNAAQSTVPAGGSMSATIASIGPIPASWPDDNNQCTSPAPAPLQDNGNSTVTITAPSAAGTYTFVPRWAVGAPESSDVTGAAPIVTFTLTVATPDTTPPTMNCTVPNQSTWYGADVVVPCTASDGGSGLANSGDASFSLSTGVASGSETASAATGSRQVCDNAGNCATAGSYTFKVDRKAPSISCGSADGVWHSANVSIACTAADGGSGVNPAGDASFSLSTDVASGAENGNAATGTKSVSDLVGNSATAGPIAGNMIDRKAPQLSSCESADGIWHATNVTLHCTYTDGGSGPASQQVALSTTVSDGNENGNAAASAGGTQACDTLGNCAPAPADIGGNEIDRKAPQLSSCETADGAWHAANLTLHCSYTDGGAGPATQNVDLTTSVAAGVEDPNATASASGAQACDNVDNCAASPADIAGNKVDRKAPEVSCGAADGSWHGSDVSIACTASDGGSGLTNSGDASFDLTTSVASGSEDANASTDSRVVTDGVGHSVTAGPIGGNKVDKKAPQLTGCDAADGVWHAANVTLHCTYTDGGSGPASQQVALHTSVAAGDEDGNAPASAGTNTACDGVNNCASSPADIAGNKVDRKAPHVSCDPADGVWHANDVSIACSATDGGSGVAPADASFSLVTNVTAGTETSNGATNSKVVSDAVGNSTTAGPVTGNKVDKKAPSISCTTPAPVFLLNQAPANVTGAATDGGSGPATQSLSGPADTSSVLGNPKSVTLNASDDVGNGSSKACSYSVIFGFHGFFQPVDNNGVYNVVNSGQAIPVKFDLSGNQGLSIFAPNSPASTVVACNGSVTTDVLEETVTAGNSSLSYDSSTGRYIYVWKTDKSWANTCRRLDVKLVDGTLHSAFFKFTR